jgi:hypothetical protein
MSLPSDVSAELASKLLNEDRSVSRIWSSKGILCRSLQMV